MVKKTKVETSAKVSILYYHFCFFNYSLTLFNISYILIVYIRPYGFRSPLSFTFVIIRTLSFLGNKYVI
jgi:hypothetical protein